MAHFAKLGTGNIVEQVIVVSNDIAITEQAGSDFINKLYNTRDVWKQTHNTHTIITLEKTLQVLVINTIKQEMLSFHLNLLTLGY
jgi:hypothetical protein